MRRMLLSVVTAAFTNVLTGCAYLTTYNKSIDLATQSYAMDVKQRVVFSQKRPGDESNSPIVVCAEPSPDALTVIGVSGGLSLSSAKTDTTGNLSGALSENGAFVGLRTHSIQLLRDAMYRLCEGYAAGAISALNFQSMQRRYQSTMMGLIAIEQLTGPVVASQALLATTAAGQAGASAGDAAVAKAQEKSESTAQAVLAAQSKSDESDAKVEAATKTSLAADKVLKEEQAKKPVDQAAVDAAKEKADGASTDLAVARREREAARRSLKVAEDSSRAATEGLRQANSRVSSSAGGFGRLGDVSGAVASSNESLTRGVVDIVKEINGSYLRDSCFSFTSDLLRDPKLITDLQGLATTEDETKVSPVLMVRALIVVCQDVLREDAARLARVNGADEDEIRAIKSRVSPSTQVRSAPKKADSSSQPASAAGVSKP